MLLLHDVVIQLLQDVLPFLANLAVRQILTVTRLCIFRLVLLVQLGLVNHDVDFVQHLPYQLGSFDLAPVCTGLLRSLGRRGWFWRLLWIWRNLCIWRDGRSNLLELLLTNLSPTSIIGVTFEVLVQLSLIPFEEWLTLEVVVLWRNKFFNRSLYLGRLFDYHFIFLFLLYFSLLRVLLNNRWLWLVE